jgi:hypothetical protein
MKNSSFLFIYQKILVENCRVRFFFLHLTGQFLFFHKTKLTTENKTKQSKTKITLPPPPKD